MTGADHLYARAAHTARGLRRRPYTALGAGLAATAAVSALALGLTRPGEPPIGPQPQVAMSTVALARVSETETGISLDPAMASRGPAPTAALVTFHPPKQPLAGARPDPGRAAARATAGAAPEGQDSTVAISLGAPPVIPPARPATGARILIAPTGEAGTGPRMAARPRLRPGAPAAEGSESVPGAVTMARATRADPRPLPRPSAGNAPGTAIASAAPDAVRPRARPQQQTPTPQAASGVALLTSLKPQGRPDFPATVAGRGAEPAQAPGLAQGAVTASLSATPGRATEHGTLSCDPRLAAAIPGRAGNAPGGGTFLAALGAAGGATRDRRIAEAIMAGNIPGFLRDLRPVTLNGRRADGTAAQITICVTPDYLALGSDSDFTRVPMGLPSARRIAERFDMLLPTTRMVDAIHAQAGLRLAPRPMAAGPGMSSTDYFRRHDAAVEGQRRAAGARAGTLVSGHKKDLVLTNRLAQAPGRVAIYGWHRADGQPIQPLSTVHGAGYADYSHGVRLVSRTAYIDGRAVDLGAALADPRIAGILSDEGTIGRASLALAALSGS